MFWARIIDLSWKIITNFHVQRWEFIKENKNVKKKKTKKNKKEIKHALDQEWKKEKKNFTKKKEKEKELEKRKLTQISTEKKSKF